MRHHMRLKDDQFKKIQSAVKTFVFRLYDENCKKVKVKDEIAFENLATGEKLIVRVISIHVFSSFEELYAALPLLKSGYTEQSVGVAHHTDMEAYYSKIEQDKYGVVGFEIERINYLEYAVDLAEEAANYIAARTDEYPASNYDIETILNNDSFLNALSIALTHVFLDILCVESDYIISNFVWSVYEEWKLSNT